MGYTHYWERPPALPRRQFAAAAVDCRRLCIALDIPLGNAMGKAEPSFTAAEICFNGHVESGRLLSTVNVEAIEAMPGGKAHQSAWRVGLTNRARTLGPGGDGSYEPFRVQRVQRLHGTAPAGGASWQHDFCKTSRLPYDLCVQGCLIVLSHHLGLRQFRVASDGTSGDWNDARHACQQILGYGINWGADKLAPTSPRPSPPPR